MTKTPLHCLKGGFDDRMIILTLGYIFLNRNTKVIIDNQKNHP
jgi:hypothetical protein